MSPAAPAYASLSATMVRRPHWTADLTASTRAAPLPWWRGSDARQFATAFVGGFLFFYALIA